MVVDEAMKKKKFGNIKKLVISGKKIILKQFEWNQELNH